MAITANVWRFPALPAEFVGRLPLTCRRSLHPKP